MGESRTRRVPPLAATLALSVLGAYSRHGYRAGSFHLDAAYVSSGLPQNSRTQSMRESVERKRLYEGSYGGET